MTDNARIAYKWINRNYHKEKEINALKIKLVKLETDINNCVRALAKSEIQTSHASNAQEVRLAEYADLKNEINKRIVELSAADKTVIKVIALLENSQERVILLERYINRKSWRRIYNGMYISKSTSFRLHENALDNLYHVIPQGDLLEVTENDT